jgi:hypothetical protein
MKIRALTRLLVSLILTTSLFAADAGKATGKFVVGGKTRKLTHAYVVEKDALLRVVLSSDALAEAEVFSKDALQDAVASRATSALVIQLDEDRDADAVFFFDPELPAGLEVRQTATFTSKRSPAKALAGRMVMKDDGFSFSFDATFESPVVVQPQAVAPLGGDASPAEHARWRLEQMEVKFDESAFRDAVIDGDVDRVTLFLTAGMPVETAGALREAVDRGKAGVVKLLLEHGADRNAKDSYGQSLVMTAASNHHVEVLDALIAAGADVNAANQYRITPLAVAAEQGHLDIVERLLAAGAKVNARDTAGGTALSVAILRGYEPIVAALLAAGADVQRDKEDLLQYAAEKPAIKAMLEKAIRETAKKR